MNTTACPCSPNQLYLACCGRFIEQGELAPTPELLMRSRYTAYTLAKVEHIQNTMRGKALIGFDVVAAREWASSVEWLKLVVLNAPPVTPDATQGKVEFLARYRELKHVVIMHELSNFEKIDDRWYYISGRPGTKISPNTPCPCGSTQKFKKCCGAW